MTEEKATSNEKDWKVEWIKFKDLELRKVDEIFTEFKKTFDAFSQGETDMQTAVKNFKMAFRSTEDFRSCLREFKEKMNGQVTIKKLVPQFPKAVMKEGGSLEKGAKALVAIFKVFNDMEKLPGKVTGRSVDCLRDVMQLDVREIASEELGEGVDLAKIPEQMEIFRDNMKEVKKAPRIVKSFFEYATSILTDVIEEICNERSKGKTKDDLSKKKTKVDADLEKNGEKMKKLEEPEPPKEIRFVSLEIPDVDRIFNDIADAVNEVVRVSNDMVDARKHLERAMKAVSEFGDDPSKAFDDYLEELRKRLKKGKVHIVISTHGDRVEVERIEGLEPKAAHDMEAGFKGTVKSGDELVGLAPDFFKTLKKLINNASDLMKHTSAIKNHVKSPKDFLAKVKALKENGEKAKEIPGDLKFFVCFVRNLVMEVVDVLKTKQDEDEEQAGGSEEGDDKEP